MGDSAFLRFEMGDSAVWENQDGRLSLWRHSKWEIQPFEIFKIGDWGVA